MDELTRERAKNFIAQNIEKTNEASQATSKVLQDLNSIYGQYSSVLSDLLEAKSKYISVVEKYLGDNPSTNLTNYFPGIQQTLGRRMSTEEMEVDSNQMDQMASLVKDLEFQKESLEDQLEKIFKKAVSNIHEIESLSLQSSSYLDDLISEVSEIYGSASMSQLIQRNTH